MCSTEMASVVKYSGECTHPKEKGEEEGMLVQGEKNDLRTKNRKQKA